MLDVTDQLRRYADAVTETIDAIPANAVGSVTTEPPHPRRPVWQPLLAVAALVLLLAGGFWAVSAATDSDSPPATNPAPTAPTIPTTPTVPPAPPIQTSTRAGVTLLDPGPLEPRGGAAIAWTGHEVVIWGGAIEPVNQGLTGPDRQFADGAYFEPATGAWRRMTKSPLPENRDTPFAVATRNGVVITRGANTAVWQPERNDWTQLENAPGAVTDLTNTGDKVVSVSANSVLDIERGDWQPLPTPPVALGHPVAAWNGLELVVLGQLLSGEPGAIAYDPPRDTWRILPAPPASLDATALSADHDGDIVIVADHERHVVAYRHDTDDWKVLPSVPARFYDDQPFLTSAPGVTVASTNNALAILLGDRWTPVPKDELEFWGEGSAVAFASGSDNQTVMYAFGMTRDGQTRFARIDPQQLAESTLTLQVGVMQLTLPDGVKVSDSGYVDESEGQTVRVLLRTPTGVCEVSSTYDGGQGGAAHPWSAYASGLTWSGRATDSDAVKVVCDPSADPDTAKAIVDATTFP